MIGQLLGQSSTVISKFGKAQVAGRDVIVHVTVVVPPGADANQIALDAVRNQGARPFQSDEFSASGLVWDQFSDSYVGNDYVLQYYNPDNDPTGGGLNALWNTHLTWTGVSTSKFAFADGGETNRCPSLVRECEGKQTFDGFNDVAWLEIRGCCTLAVTWYGTSIDEADMAINTKFSWSTDGINDFDLESVVLHENGHVVG
ncbi:proprotein convertase P, partial [Acidobacteria bacterium AH-259-O06]|nr:proprotein convertase P [Acidobacteria bacterium AH-259-O06]